MPWPRRGARHPPGSRRTVTAVRPTAVGPAAGAAGEQGAFRVERRHFLTDADRTRPGGVSRPALRPARGGRRRFAALLVLLALVVAAVACAATPTHDTALLAA